MKKQIERGASQSRGTWCGVTFEHWEEPDEGTQNRRMNGCRSTGKVIHNLDFQEGTYLHPANVCGLTD